MKIYNDDDKKYGGELYDTFDFKLQIFYDYCAKVGLEDYQYDKAFSVMLKGRASSFYYNKISGRNMDWNTAVTMMRSHFETEENRQLYLSLWRETTLLRTIQANPSKSRLDCLQLLLDQLQKIQRGLGDGYQSDHTLRDQAINACRGVKECSLALYKPASTYEGVCAELRSAIGTAVRSEDNTQYMARSEEQRRDRFQGNERTGRGQFIGQIRGSYLDERPYDNYDEEPYDKEPDYDKPYKKRVPEGRRIKSKGVEEE